MQSFIEILVDHVSLSHQELEGMTEGSEKGCRLSQVGCQAWSRCGFGTGF